MLNVITLGSGSAGNCALVESARCRVLVDAGLSARQIVLRLAEAGVDPSQLDGILITHEHCDHAKGLEVLLKKFDIPIYTNSLTAEALGENIRKRARIFQTGSEFSLNDLVVQTFSIPHDAVDPTGFILHAGSASLGICTDLGFATKLVMERLRSANTILIETNHDEKMLQENPYRPWSLKQRIMSRHGHLSNTAAATVLEQLVGNGLRRAILAHLSRDCNTPEIASNTVRSQLDRTGDTSVEIFCAAQDKISPRFAV